MSDINLKNKIMRRVYAIWFFRQITSPVFIEGFVFTAMLFLTASYISFLNVMRNALSASSSVFSLPNFFLNAFVNTDAISKFLSLGTMIMIMVLVRELFKKRPQLLEPTS